MRRVWLICLALPPSLWSGPAQSAELAAQAYIDAANKGPASLRSVQVSLGGYTHAYMWTNGLLKNIRKETPLFCPPAKLNLNGKLALTVLRKHVKNHPYEAKHPVGIVLLNGYRDAYPCD